MSQATQTAIYSQLIDPKTGMLTRAGLILFRIWQQQLANGLDPNGNLISDIEPTVKIVGHGGDLGTILQFISDLGVMQSAGLFSATPAEQGAVVMPTGAPNNVLGTAAVEPSGAFDPAGAANTAQTAAEAHADTVAATAQANAETFATTAIATAFSPGISVTITTAKLTTLGSNGSMTFSDGLLIGQVAAT